MDRPNHLASVPLASFCALHFRIWTDWPSYCITIAASVVFYGVLWRENKKREGYVGNEEDRDKNAFLDLTDKENPYFRYVL